MRVILPPSETKRSGGGSVFSAEQLSFHAELGSTRSMVRTALEAVSGHEIAAISALKLGVKSRSERLHNLAFATSRTLPAIERYTGVLFDALDAPTLDETSRQWIERQVFVQSALFGLISAADQIPAYRLSASSRLAELTAPLATVWQEAHRSVDLSAGEWILDLRSQDYVKLAPVQGENSAYLHVTQRSADGTVRALNHFNKAAKGLLVRALATSRAKIQNAVDLCEWGAKTGFNLEHDQRAGTITLVLGT